MVQHLVGDDPLEPAVLVLERFEPTGLADVHAGELRFSRVVRLRRHPATPNRGHCGNRIVVRAREPITAILLRSTPIGVARFHSGLAA
jgi:hypothetical protein